MTRTSDAIVCLVANWGGFHPAAWREETVPARPQMNFDEIRRMVEIAERGKLHGVFLADGLASGFLGHEVSMEALSRTLNGVGYEPLTLLSALVGCTKHIGLMATASTTYSEPYNVARMFASLDFISRGRAGWNVVATASAAAARNFGREKHLGHAERYERAQEFVDIVKGLWDSWEDDAFLNDKAEGRSFDPDKVHVLNYRGKYLASAGPLNVARPPQGHPVILQAGASAEGREFAARNAEIVFTFQASPEKGRRFRTELKELGASYGRDPDGIKIMLGLPVVIGRSDAHALEKLARLDSLVDEEGGKAMLRTQLGSNFDLSGVSLDDPVPDVPPSEEQSQSAQRFFIETCKKDQLTVRQAMQRAARVGARPLGAKATADLIQEWVEAEGADGFGLMLADAGDSLEIFVDEVVPELQRRGLFQTDYRGTTLRENLGLPRPPNRLVADSH